MTGETGEIIVGVERERAVRAATADTGPLFHHSLLCQFALPRRRTEARVFERRSGKASLLMEAGRWYTAQGWVPQPLPYGTRPRLVFVNLCAEAVRTRSRTVSIEASVRAFLRRLGIDGGGSPMREFKRQMIALYCSRMELGYETLAGGTGQVDARPISRFEAWPVVEAAERKVWPGELDLSSDFFESLLEHAVPLDPAALAGLQNSAMALDVYCWLAHRLCRVRQSLGVRVSWPALREQFGQEFAEVKDFRRWFIEALRVAQSVYPEARFEIERGWLKLLPSPPPVARTSVTVRKEGGRPAEPLSPQPVPSPTVPQVPAAAAAAPVPDGGEVRPGHRFEDLDFATLRKVEELCPQLTARQLWERSPFAAGGARFGDLDWRFKSWVVGFMKTREGGADGAIAAAVLPQVTAPRAAETAGGRLKAATLEAARELAPAYDPLWLEEKFFSWNAEQGVALRNADRAFLAWVRTFTKAPGTKPTG